MRRRCSWPANAPSRSSARCASRSSTIRRSPSARPPARPSSRSTAAPRPTSTGASSRSRAKPDGRLALDGRGEPVEWAVEMRRFDESATLDHLAAAGKIDAALADALGRTVAASHADARARRRRALDRGARKLHRRACRSVRPAARPVPARRRTARSRTPAAPPSRASGRCSSSAGGPDSSAASTATCTSATSFCSTSAPVLFDAIEFSEVIASGDVLYDLAFLLMDLVERDLAPAANIVFNRYLVEVRARREPRRARRAAVLPVDARRDPRQGDRGAAGAREAGRAAGDRAQRPHLFRLGAPLHRPGAAGDGRGRRAVGHRQVGAGARARADAGAAAGRGRASAPTSSARRCSARASSSRCRQTAYTPEIDRAGLRRDRREGAPRAVAAGHSAILDAVFARPDEREQAERAAAGRRRALPGPVPRQPTWRPARNASAARERDASDANADVARAQESYDLGALAWHRVDASGTPETTLQRAKAALA